MRRKATRRESMPPRVIAPSSLPLANQSLRPGWASASPPSRILGPMIRKLLTLTLAVLLVGLFAAVVFAAVESGDGSPSSTTFGTTDTTDTTGTTETTGTTQTTTTPGDISGPCDEAEHANDPRCAGVAVPPAAPSTTPAPQGGVDISGPCDEPEHFADPRCTGAQPGAGDSSGSGPGFDDDSGHSGGSNSGPGSGGFDDSGRSGFDDDSGHSGDDDSGRGRGRGRGRGGDDD